MAGAVDLAPVANKDRGRAEVPDLVPTEAEGAVSDREKDPDEARASGRRAGQALGLAGQAESSVPTDVPALRRLPKQSRNRKLQ